MADAMMTPLGEANGVQWYWAEPGKFDSPGVYYWDGNRNVLCVPYPAPTEASKPVQAEAPSKFRLGDMVQKTKGSQWRGTVVGTYSTDLTAEGYAVESSAEKGSVQIYPAVALELATPPTASPVRESSIDLFAMTSEWSKAKGKKVDSDTVELLHWLTGGINGTLEVVGAASPVGEREALTLAIRAEKDAADRDTPYGCRDTLERCAKFIRAALATQPQPEQKPVVRMLNTKEVQRCTLGLGGQAAAVAVQRQFAAVNGLKIDTLEAVNASRARGEGA